MNGKELIELSLPPSINQAYKTTRQGRFYKSKECKDWEVLAGYELMAQKPSYGLTGAIRVEIEMHFARDRDIDSSIKIILDLFQKQGVYVNDSQIIELKVKKYRVAKGEQHCKVGVYEI